MEQVDRSPPGLTTKRPPSTVENLGGGGGRQGIYITSRHLQASDPDSPAQELEYVITRPPHFGYLENALTGTLTSLSPRHPCCDEVQTVAEDHRIIDH